MFKKDPNFVIVFTSDDQGLHHKNVFRDIKVFANFMLSIANKSSVRVDSIVYVYEDEN